MYTKYITNKRANVSTTYATFFVVQISQQAKVIQVVDLFITILIVYFRSTRRDTWSKHRKPVKLLVH